ncbi:MAG: amidohydrolase family protein [Chloroflexi bacterium]|nr:amidohydrolase family protein [Chloroflexota bacterium]
MTDLENHFGTELWMDALRKNKGFPRVEEGRGIGYFADSWIPIGATGAREKLLDLGEGRIALMDAAGVDFAVLSLTAPGVEAFDPALGTRLARDANDRLAEACARYPDRFGGFATLAPKDVDSAVQELERCAKELGFVGWNTHSNFGDSRLDEKRYWPILAKAEELGVSIYLHPTVPNIPELCSFGIALSGPNFGFGTDATFTFLRMIARGVFDAFPGLKIILGHFGEALPFLLNRVDCAYRQGWPAPNPDIGPGSLHPNSHYLIQNMWVTTSGNYLPAAYICTRDSIGTQKILLATDHPYERIEEGVDFLKGLALPESEQAMVCHKNAAELGFAPRG